jgi:predicted lipoprotein with Yx(FWY)xxD motif
MFKRSFPVIIFLALTLLLAACGSPSSNTGSSSGTTPTAAPTTAPTATTAPTSALVMTATATVGGKSETILTNAQGRTLYYFTPDTSTNAACGSGCTSAWPPLLFTGSGSPTASSTLPGTLSAVSDGNGTQCEYNGHPLYTFSGDTAAGQTNGEGIGGKWFVATPDLAKIGGASSSPTATPTTSYGY